MKNRKSQEKIKYWRSPYFNNIELMHANYLTHTFSKHFHESHFYAIYCDRVEVKMK